MKYDQWRWYERCEMMRIYCHVGCFRKFLLYFTQAHFFDYNNEKGYQKRKKKFRVKPPPPWLDIFNKVISPECTKNSFDSLILASAF